MFIESFKLPIDEESDIIEKRSIHNGGDRFSYIDNPYPCLIFDKKELPEINFGNITVFYGGNGSGKSTLLNLIAEKLQLIRISPFNKGETFDDYVARCTYTLSDDDEGFPRRIPDGSRIITSDDIFDYMLAVRGNNDEISESKETARSSHYDIKFGDTVKLRSMDDYDELRTQVLARRKSVSRREFIKRTAGSETKLGSNGETAMDYFDSKMKNDTLYLLDEPENSMSASMQIKFVRFIEDLSRYCGCQLVIATHSPFILSLDGAKIYDLDSTPASVRKWWELEAPKIYFDFFNRHRRFFEKN